MCNCRKFLYKSFEYDGGNFIFGKKCFVDKECVDVIICQNLCGEDEEQIVTFEFDGVKYPVLNRYGDAAKVKDIRCRKLYHALFSTEVLPGQFIITNSGRC